MKDLLLSWKFWIIILCLFGCIVLIVNLLISNELEFLFVGENVYGYKQQPIK